MTSSPPSPGPPTDERIGAPVRISLYVAGESPNSMMAVVNVRSVLAAHPGHRVALEIVDVLKTPDRGLRDGVLVTPMLIRLEPLPERRVLGSLRDRAALLGLLGFETTP